MPTRKAKERNPKEFFETPPGFTRALLRGLHPLDLAGKTIFECAVGQQAISRVIAQWYRTGPGRHLLSPVFITNDIDPKWMADFHLDATKREVWERALEKAGGRIDYTITNPPFSAGFVMLPHALEFSSEGVCFHLRCTSLEPTKGRDAFWQETGGLHIPDQLNYLPRYGFTLNDKGKRSSDSATTAWHTWLRGDTRNEMRHHPLWQPIIVSPRAVKYESWELPTPLELTT
jgi:hypothetical protein